MNLNPIALARAILVALILGLSIPAIAEVHGVFRVVKGNVQIKSGATGTIGRARLGQEVYPKDTIITGKDARAKIVMIDNNELNISPDSQIEIKNYEYNPAQNKKDVLLNVLYGKVRSKVEQKYDGKTSKFQVKTPSAVAGVRGTDFMTSYNQTTHQSQVVTFRGAVQFGLPGPNGAILRAVFVTPGKTAQVMRAGVTPTVPVDLPKEQYAKFDHETKVEPSATNKGSSSEPRTPAGHEDRSGKQDGSSSNGSGSTSGAASNVSGHNGSMLMPSADLVGGTSPNNPSAFIPAPPAPSGGTCSTCVPTPALPPPPPPLPPVNLPLGGGKLTVHVTP